MTPRPAADSSAHPDTVHNPVAPNPDERRWRVLALLAVVQLLGMSLWFTAGAATAPLAARWSLDAGQAAALVTFVQFGFVAGTALAALLNLADIVSARLYLAVSAVLAAVSNGMLLFVDGYAAALATRAATGFFLAGVYPPAMKMAATWFRTRRGLAIGVIVGALTIGKATPYLLTALPGADWRRIVLIASIGALVAALLVVVGYRDGPYPFAARPFSLRLVGRVVRDRPTRLAIGGYLGHMWELYAGWATLGAFFHFYFGGRGWEGTARTAAAGAMAFGAIAMGGAGSILAGIWADRWGRENVAAGAMVVSAVCALTLGWMLAAPVWLVCAVALVWGFAIVADSAQFSALVTEVAPGHAVGTALTLQTSLGFALTTLSIWLTVEIADRVGWGPAFSMLAVGPALGIVAMLRLRSLRRQAAAATAAPLTVGPAAR